MRKFVCTVSTVASFAALLSTGQTAHAEDVSHYPVDAWGYCIYPRDFSHISDASRPRVESFWNNVAAAHRVSQRRINEDTSAGMHRNSVDQRKGLSDEQSKLREKIRADGWAKERQDEQAYRQQYDALMGTLPTADRDAAMRALAVLIEPVDPNCPKGFETNPVMGP